ncbi:TM2 domain-containing protein [Rhodovibrio salinarum]|uniref:TM2 domain-containing protein n=1 Tax=Rhodovibrio salinarum TaxID=1087 RepID=UPI0004B22CAA|nr:TM2 domain-containing protein [Rhodovibrio salinarum]
MYCQECGKEISAQAIQCPGCGSEVRINSHIDPNPSPKNYGVAVALSGIFGVVGIHHFYLGNIAHGVLDLTMLIGGIACLEFADPVHGSDLLAFGGLLLFADIIHTLVVTYRLIAGKQRDGQGRRVLPPQHA